jgi:heptaprenyl diphosphate synthase
MKLAVDKKPVSRKTLKKLKEFERHFESRLAAASPEISGPSLTAVKAGGKRLRPALVIICAGLGHDPDRSRLLDACAAVELVHLASLVHDDVLDAAATRRGVSTVHADYGQRRAVQLGDYLFGLAFRLLADHDDNALIEPLARASVQLSRGELEQRRTLRRLDQSVDDYMDKIFTKTAALFVASCAIGARLGGLKPEQEAALEEYAGNLGMAFQVYDDILDFTGDEATLGKPVGSDLREGTVTLPMIFALNHDGEGLVAKALLRPEGTAIDEAVDFINGGPAIDQARAMAKKFVSQAENAVDRLPDSPAARELISLGKFVVDRYH